MHVCMCLRRMHVCVFMRACICGCLAPMTKAKATATEGEWGRWTSNWILEYWSTNLYNIALYGLVNIQMYDDNAAVIKILVVTIVVHNLGRVYNPSIYPYLWTFYSLPASGREFQAVKRDSHASNRKRIGNDKSTPYWRSPSPSPGYRVFSSTVAASVPLWLPWSEWSNCSRRCGGDIVRRIRRCARPGSCGWANDTREAAC